MPGRVGVGLERMRFIVKVLISLGVITLCSWIVSRQKLPALGGLIAVMPLTGLIVLVWVYTDNPGNAELLADYTRGALFGIVPSILFFLVAYVCFKRHLPLWVVLCASFAVWLTGAVVHQWLLHKPD